MAQSAEFAILLRELPADRHHEFERLGEIWDVVVTPLTIGLGTGILAAFTVAVLAISLAIGRRLRDRPPQVRVELVPRVSVALLQSPTLLLVPALGHARLGGVVAGTSDALVGASDEVPREAAIALELLHAHAPLLLLVGLAAWILGALHLQAVLALAEGRLWTRLVLAGFALAPVLAPATIGAASLLLWLAAIAWSCAGLGALYFARPRDPPSTSRRARS